MKITTFDMDGVITIGIYPGPNDVIITGRSIEEARETMVYLRNRGIFNAIYMNPSKYDDKSREGSGRYKARVISMLKEAGHEIEKHIDDDEIQIAEINKFHPDLPIVHVVSNLVNKENMRHSCEEVQ